ncbi:unnamed protein product [Cuscuta epithymum]|uniref:C2 domain-containing protein n=1 Tax=Cuscuta epithymum TaxID=186058 RepID=A0AAV0FKF0_9ASTE|nr:unnamed protein product [Cuscuta epithymum]
MGSTTDTSAASSTVTTASHHPPSHHILEITLISAQDLAPISKSQRTYALIWVNPNKKRSTNIDPKGHTNPTWNHKFSFRVDDEFLGSEASAVTVEIYAVAWFRDILVGTVRLNVNNILTPPSPGIVSDEKKNERFMALQTRRPSGDPQGMLNMGVALFDAATRSKPICSDVSASSSDCRDLLEKKMNKFLTGDEISEEFPANPGSICRAGSAVNGSAICGGSEVCSDIGPSASVVAAEIAMKSNPPAEQSNAGPQRRKGGGECGESVILEELTAEEAAAKGMTNQPEVVKKKGRLFSCYGFEVTIVCGARKKQKSD